MNQNHLHVRERLLSPLRGLELFSGSELRAYARSYVLPPLRG
jgi:hypothetical protein